ncbi:MAG: lysoplasmalogenase [Dermatophilaceae bacterium]|nr:lysoplasmalogenase [Dermatophilaceae bacterium]
MNSVTALFVVVAVFNEIAVLFGRRDAERWLKPGALVALIGVALSLGALDTSVGRWILVALVCSLAGDVFLLGDAEGSFIRGLASFLLGHLAYVVAFLLLAQPTWSPVVALVLVALVIVGRWVFLGARAQGGPVLGGAVAAYMAVIGTMAALGVSLGRPVLGAGALLFLVSDAVLGWDRFVARQPWARVVVMTTYHLGQLLIVIGAIGAGALR